MTDPTRRRPRHRSRRPARRLLPVFAAMIAVLLSISTAPALGAYSAKIANSADTAGTTQYFKCADALGADKGSALFQWPMSDGASTAATSSVADISGNARSGVFQGTRTADSTAPLACPRDGGSGTVFDGSTNYADYATSQAASNVFTIEVWFKTTTPTGKLIGFGNAATGSSSTFDRHLYINKSGGVTFGVYPGSAKTVASPLAYTDGKWHYAAGTLSSAGMVLYMDGVKVASDTTVTTAQSFTGYWRVGYDNLGSWPNIGTSAFFAGSIRYAAVYGATALTATQIANHYGAGIGS